MMGHDVQLLRVRLPGNWAKVTESNWFCVQFWLHCCSQAITLPCWYIFFFIPREISVSKIWLLARSEDSIISFLMLCARSMCLSFGMLRVRDG